MSKYTFEEILEMYRPEQEYYLNKTRIKYYTYPYASIVSILLKLMSTFEGVEYYLDYNQKLKPCCNYKFSNIYPSIIIKSFKLGSGRPEDIEYSFFGVATLDDPGIFYSYKNDIKVEYIKCFFNYLYKYRVKNDSNEIDLDDLLNNYLSETKDWQDKVKSNNIIIKNGIIKKEEEKAAKAKERKFLDSFKINRLLIYYSLAHVINKYEDDMEVNNRYDRRWHRNGNWSELSLYHTLIIKSKDDKCEHSTLIGTDGHYPDEEGLAYVNRKAKTTISFYTFKKTVEWYLKDTKYAKKFLDDIWQELIAENTISEETIIRLLSNIKQQYKKDNKVLIIK